MDGPSPPCAREGREQQLALEMSTNQALFCYFLSSPSSGLDKSVLFFKKMNKTAAWR
jgi:hypothetical protein